MLVIISQFPHIKENRSSNQCSHSKGQTQKIWANLLGDQDWARSVVQIGIKS